MCRLAEVSRAGYYRHWQASAPRQEETGLRDVIQALAHRHYGHRRIAALVHRAGWPVNHKRVLRLMREANHLCLRRASFVPAMTDSQHGWRVVPNLARGMELTGLDQLWVADITYVRMAEEFAYLAIGACHVGVPVRSSETIVCETRGRPSLERSLINRLGGSGRFFSSCTDDVGCVGSR
jgi:putative transposase